VKVFLRLSWPPSPKSRFGVAILASALAHTLTLLTVLDYPVGGGFTRPVFAPLSVRIERSRDLPAASALVTQGKKSLLSVAASATVSGASILPPEIDSLPPEPGVSLSEALYLRPIGGLLSSPLLDGGEFHQPWEVSEKAAMLRVSMPKYPQAMREQKIGGWVTVLVFVDEGGKVVDTAALKASEVLDDYKAEVAAAMRHSTFIPAKVDRRPVKSLILITVRFDAPTIFDTVAPTTAPVFIQGKAKP
jgi:TonB family protein